MSMRMTASSEARQGQRGKVSGTVFYKVLYCMVSKVSERVQAT